MKAPGNLERAVEITAWLRRHYAPWQGGGTASAGLAWVRWFLACGLLGVVRYRGRILGVGAVRRVLDPADGLRPYVHHPDGVRAWVDFVVCTDRRAFPVLWSMLLQRARGCAVVGGAKDKAGGRVRWMPVARMTRMILGGTVHQAEGEGGPHGLCPQS